MIVAIRKKLVSHGQEIVFTCDFCGKQYVKTYKKRLLRKTNFCTSKCLGSYLLANGITKRNLFSETNRNKAQETKRTSGGLLRQKQKNLQTVLQKYGVPNVSMLDEVKKKKKSTTLTHYGVDHHWKSSVVREKIHRTMIENGTYGKSSKGEVEFLGFLRKIFGEEEEEVLHLVMVNGYEVDFFIKPIETYIQFDGAYWHGLDRNMEEIMRSTNARDIGILRTHEKDKKQDLWFKEAGLRLIRVTDKQFNTYKKSERNDRLRTLFADMVAK